jgi:ornithine cyclodeaminase
MRFVTEAEVEATLTAAGVVADVEAALGRGAVPESAATEIADARLGGWAEIALDGGRLGVLAAAAGSRASGRVLIVTGPDGEPEAAIEAAWLTRLTAAAGAVAALRRVAPVAPGVAAVIGGGNLGRAVATCLEEVLQLEPRRGELRDAQRLARGAAVVVTATRARDPVVRDDWLGEGTLVAALGATRPGERELDYRTLVRASLVLCDSAAAARRRSADLIETVAGGHLDWLEVHDLAEAVRGELEELVRPADVVVYEGVGSAALTLAAATPLLEGPPR